MRPPDPDTGPRPARRRADDVVPALAARLAGALRAGDPAAARAVVDEALALGVAAPAVAARVVGPAMRRIGDLWERGAVGVADEHLATSLVFALLGDLHARTLRPVPRHRGSVVVAAPEGERHVLGLRMAADVLEGAGFDVAFLGADVPAGALASWAATHEPDVLLLGTTMALSARPLVRAVEAVRTWHPEIRVVAGGPRPPFVLTGIPGLLVTEDLEGLPGAVEALLAGPPCDELPATLRPALVRGEARTTLPGGGSREARMAEAAAAAADAARAAARRARDLEDLALRDPLTGLLNRRGFEDRHAELVAAAEDVGPAVLVVDVDHFKAVNDRLGHDAGDAVLAAIAACITEALRDGDVAARPGGDEFAVLLPAASAAVALRIGERIRTLVAERVVDPPVTVSIGVALPSSSDRRRVTHDGDHALLLAKSRGRNRVTLVPGQEA